ncbi:hypothetical protein EE612_047924 [Oryza sativa]|nr:hypothetical protein EE612_047924 [Oryza sativa]
MAMGRIALMGPTSGFSRAFSRIRRWKA